tara:strand:+ start:2868 stop:3305 length:438 start_codon:yes stop_codon:yes gene_type:complete
VLALVADVPALLALLAAFVSEVAALLADVDALVAEFAALVAEVAASVAFAVTALIVMSVVASPAPPSPRYIAMYYPKNRLNNIVAKAPINDAKLRPTQNAPRDLLASSNNSFRSSSIEPTFSSKDSTLLSSFPYSMGSISFLGLM